MSGVVCSEASTAAGEALIGSAPQATAWVCLEQNGPWGGKAWTESRLDPAIGAEVEKVADEHRVRPSLIRRPGRHPDEPDGERTVLVASTHPQNSWLLSARVPEAGALLSLDWAAIGTGDRDRTLASLPGAVPSAPVLLVCTNGTRDTCCARLGRPVASAAAAAFPDRVWEVTHTSGHRFAATTVLLPSGTLHGRVLDAAPLLGAADRGELVVTGYRGRSTWSPGAQVAEEWIRREYGVTGIDDLVVVPEVDAWRVRHRDGRSWWVAVKATPDGERPESCDKPAKPITRYRAEVVGSVATG